MSDSLARTFRVTGQVQGVGFRWSAQVQARALGLAGWVTNDADGSVSGLAQGTEESLDRFRQWLSRGPRSARVDNLEWSEAENTGLRIFTVR